MKNIGIRAKMTAYMTAAAIMVIVTGCQNKKSSIDYRAMYKAVDYGEGDVYVIGHKSPDSDSVCSAIGYAEVLSKIGIDCKARITAKPNPETQYALEYFKVEAPEILDNADGKNVILVDHNMYSQAADGMENANIVGVIDHHNVGDVQTGAPVVYKELPIGCTATGVYMTAKELGVEIEPETAGLLATAILSDTVNLTSVTTTPLDKEALKYLSKKSGLKDVDSYFDKMVEAKESYKDMTDAEILLSDYKEYDMEGRLIAIASVEARGEVKRVDMAKRMLTEASKVISTSSVEHIFIMLNDGENDLTEVVYCGDGAENIAQEAFSVNEEGKIIIDHVASRKKDMVPPLTATYKLKGSH